MIHFFFVNKAALLAYSHIWSMSCLYFHWKGTWRLHKKQIRYVNNSKIFLNSWSEKSSTNWPPINQQHFKKFSFKRLVMANKRPQMTDIQSCVKIPLEKKLLEDLVEKAKDYLLMHGKSNYFFGFSFLRNIRWNSYNFWR